MRNYRKLKNILSFIFVLVTVQTSAQLAKVVDKDGYVNVRQEPRSTAKIIGKIEAGNLVYIMDVMDSTGDWVLYDLAVGEEQKTDGYIHLSRLKLLDSYEDISAAIADESKATFILRSVYVEIKSGKFDYAKNQKYFAYGDYSGTKIMDRYKNEPIWGTDGTIPKTYYISIVFQLGSKTISIPQKDLDGLFNINNELTTCIYDKSDDTYYLVASNSDGAGSYTLVFIVKNGVYKGKKIFMPF